MYKKILGTFALAFALVLTSNAFAHSGMCGDRMKSMLDSMNLDSAQKEKIKPIMETLKSNMKQSAEQMKDLDKQMDEQMVSGQMDQNAMNGLIDKKSKLIGDMMKAKMMAKSQISSVLTAEQKEQWQSMMKKMKAKMEEKFKNCHDED